MNFPTGNLFVISMKQSLHVIVRIVIRFLFVHNAVYPRKSKWHALRPFMINVAEIQKDLSIKITLMLYLFVSVPFMNHLRFKRTDTVSFIFSIESIALPNFYGKKNIIETMPTPLQLNHHLWQSSLMFGIKFNVLYLYLYIYILLNRGCVQGLT